MKNIFFTLLLISSITFSQIKVIDAVETGIEKTDTSGLFFTDEYNYSYFLKNNVLLKIGNSQRYEYQNISLGKIYKVDLQNPLRIVIFYQNFNTIVALDSQLNEISKINFNNLNQTISLAATGTCAQNNYWIFNELNQQLYLFNYTQKNFQPLGIIFEDTIKTYSTNYNHFIWIDIKNKIYSCDIFGKKRNLGFIDSYDFISLSNDNFIPYLKGKQFYIYDITTSITYELKNIKNYSEIFYFKNQILSIFTNEGIIQYKINLP